MKNKLLQEVVGRVYDRLNYGPGSSLYLPNVWLHGDVYFDSRTIEFLEDMNINPADLSPYIKEKGDTVKAGDLLDMYIYRNNQIVKSYPDLEALLWDVKFPAM